MMSKLYGDSSHLHCTIDYLKTYVREQIVSQP